VWMSRSSMATSRMYKRNQWSTHITDAVDRRVGLLGDFTKSATLAFKAGGSRRSFCSANAGLARPIVYPA